MTLYLFPIITILLFFAFQQLRKLVRDQTEPHNGTIILLAVTGGLLLDSLVASAGHWIGEGELLTGLSLGRWWLRLILFPLLIVTYVEMTGRLEIQAAKTPVVRSLVWVLALVLVAAQVWANRPALQIGGLETVNLDGALLVVPREVLVLVGDIAAHLIGAAFGLFMLVKGRWPWVVLTAAAVSLEATLFPQSALAAAFIEVALIWSLVMTEARAQREGFGLSRQTLADRFERIEGK